MVTIAGLAAEMAEFRPMAYYQKQLDAVEYVREDVSYRAERIDPFLTLLWHPQLPQVVGVKLKGFRFLFEQLRTTLNLGENDFFPIVEAVERALVEGLNDDSLERLPTEVRSKFYRMAREVVGGAGLPPSEWHLAA